MKMSSNLKNEIAAIKFAANKEIVLEATASKIKEILNTVADEIKKGNGDADLKKNIFFFRLELDDNSPLFGLNKGEEEILMDLGWKLGDDKIVTTNKNDLIKFDLQKIVDQIEFALINESEINFQELGIDKNTAKVNCQFSWFNGIDKVWHLGVNLAIGNQ